MNAALTAERAGSEIVFSLAVANRTGAPLQLLFTDAGRLDVTVTDERDAVVWNSRAGRMFAAVSETVVVAPLAAVTFTETWTPGDLRGRFTVRATLRSRPPCAASLPLDVPSVS